MTNFKKLLLAGTAVVAIGAVATTVTVAPAQAAGEFLFDEDNDAATAGTSRDTGDTANFDTHDITFVNGPAVLNVANGETIGNSGAAASAGAIVGAATAEGDTLTITGDADNAEAGITITGDIDKGAAAGFNLIFVPITEDSDNDESMQVDLNGNVDLGTGTLTVRSNDAQNGTQSNSTTINLSGNLTAASIVLDQDNTSADAPTINAVIALDGSTNQTVTGAITAETDGEGGLYVNNTTNTATFASDIGTAAGNSVALVQVGTAAVGAVDVAAGAGNAVFNGLVDATNIGVGYIAATAASSADFNGNVVGATTITASTGAAVNSTATFAGNVTGTIALTDGAGNGQSIATFDGETAQTVSGAVTATNREGVVNANGTGGVTFQSDIGTGGAGLGLFTVGSSGVATLQNDLFTDSTSNAAAAGVDVDGTLNLDTSGGTVAVLEDAGDIDVDGTLSITGSNNATLTATAGNIFIDGSSTFSTALTGTGETNLVAGTDIGFATSANTVINLSNPLNLNATGEVKVGDGTPAAGGDGFNTTINVIRTASFDPTAVDVIDQTGEFNFDGDGVVTFTIGSTTTEFDTGDTITLVDGDTAPDLNGAASTFGALITSGDVVLQDTAFLNLESNAAVTDVGAGDLGVTVTVNSAANVLAGASYDNFADTLLTTITSATTTTGGTLETFRGAVQGATTANVQRLVESGAPTVDGAAQTGVVTTVTNSALGLTGDRLASLRQGDETGMAAGNMTHGLKVWGQVFGTTGDQDLRDGVSGYDVDGWGVTVGVDTQTLAEDWVWGLAFTYADTEVDSDNLARTNIDLDTYQIGLYADYKWDAATYINGQIGYASNDGDQTKTNAGGAGLIANADVDSDVFYARLEAGRDYDMDNGWTLTPITMLNFQHIDSDNYTETGTCGALCLTNVSVDDIQIFEAGIGGEASYLHQNADGSFLKPKLHAAYRYDFIGDEVETTGSFADPLATATFTANGADAQQSTFNVGAGLSFYTTSNWELSANYDYEIKEDFDAHNGYLKAAYKF